MSASIDDDDDCDDDDYYMSLRNNYHGYSFSLGITGYNLLIILTPYLPNMDLELANTKS